MIIHSIVSSHRGFDGFAHPCLRPDVRIEIMDRGLVELRPEDEVALGVGHGHQVDKVLDQKPYVAVSSVKWLSWVSKFFLVFNIQF